VGDRVIIDGRVFSAGDKARVDSIVQLYKGEVESIVRFDEYSAARRAMFALLVHVVEIKTEDAHHLGLDVPSQFGATTDARIDYSKDLNGGGSSSVLSAVVQSNPLLIGLNLLSREGLVTIRSTSTVVTEAGETALYDVGGRLFVKSTGINTGSLDRSNYGTTLKLLPTWDEEQRVVKLTIDANVSSVDNSQIVDGIPSLITNGIQTRVNLKESETIILSGLDARNEGHTDTGLWPFARIPVLGYLFKSQVANDTRRRTLIFVTPNLYKPGDDLHRKTLEPMLDRENVGTADDF
jgi:type II secretory pathway component GspD/PulD (secretin)